MDNMHVCIQGNVDRTIWIMFMCIQDNEDRITWIVCIQDNVDRGVHVYTRQCG